ncbi:MAG TPA: hypothetical protein VF377_00715 [Acidimicrobiia bacterium]|jgi:predicted lipoprotein with Yx(FWY)xxD motif
MRRTTLAIAAALVLVAACGGGETAETTTAAAPETTVAATTSETTAAPTTTAADTAATETTAMGDAGGYGMPSDASGGAAAVQVADTELGQILTDSDGKTLYIFLPDNQSASTCYDDCAANWPPLVGEVTAGEGIDESLVGTTERDDGETQVTYNGWPLYYFAADAGPGDINGQGVGDNWFVIDPSGEVVDG